MAIKRVFHEDGSVTEVPVPDLLQPEFKTLTGSQFIGKLIAALGVTRCDELLNKSKTVEIALNKATTIDRNSGNFPILLQAIMTGDGALTTNELTMVEEAWKTF